MSQGTIKRWNDEKGFGFIKSNEYEDDIFCHISTFKNLPQGLRPAVGDVVDITVKKTAKGLQVTKAFYPNANNYNSQSNQIKSNQIKSNQIKSNHRRHYSQEDSNSFFGSITSIVIFISIVAIAYFGYQNYFNNDNVPTQPKQIDTLTSPVYVEPTNQTSSKATTNSQDFTCDGRQHCSQMNSYEEAKYFIDHCPNTKMDGDGDGIPCESQFGRH